MNRESDNTRVGEAAVELRERAASVDAQGGPERRHELLMARAEGWGLERSVAEDVYALAEEEGLEPELALLLVASGLGVGELEPVERDPEGPGVQQAPPDWVSSGEVGGAVAQRERRLRVSFRRLRASYAESGSATEAVDRFAAEPDVIEDAY